MKPYVIRMAGGLANRMFQYSYWLYLVRRGNNAFVDNNYKATKWKMEDIDWGKIFPYAEIRQAPSKLIFKYGGGYDVLSKIRRHYLPFTASVYEMPNAFYIPEKDVLDTYHYYIGIYQAAAMVDSIKDEILNRFRFSVFEDPDNQRLEEEMKRSNSVAIHVRKGKDYLMRPNFQGTCDMNYYHKAINYITEHTNNPSFYIFTDNQDWVKEHFGGINYQLVDINPSVGWGNHFDMQLMSCCKHNIIANSTYSWWGAYLNNNANKIVVGPLHWFNENMERYKGLQNKTLADGWIAI